MLRKGHFVYCQRGPHKNETVQALILDCFVETRDLLESKPVQSNFLTICEMNHPRTNKARISRHSNSKRHRCDH